MEGLEGAQHNYDILTMQVRVYVHRSKQRI